MVLISITLCSAWHVAGVDELLASVIYAVWAGFAYINTVSDGLHVWATAERSGKQDYISLTERKVKIFKFRHVYYI